MTQDEALQVALIVLSLCQAAHGGVLNGSEINGTIHRLLEVDSKGGKVKAWLNEILDNEPNETDRGGGVYLKTWFTF